MRYYKTQHSLDGARWISLIQRRRTATSSSDRRDPKRTYYIYAIELVFESDKFAVCEFHSYEPARELADELAQICEVRLSDYVRGDR